MTQHHLTDKLPTLVGTDLTTLLTKLTKSHVITRNQHSPDIITTNQQSPVIIIRNRQSSNITEQLKVFLNEFKATFNQLIKQ